MQESVGNTLRQRSLPLWAHRRDINLHSQSWPVEPRGSSLGTASRSASAPRRWVRLRPPTQWRVGLRDPLSHLLSYARLHLRITLGQPKAAMATNNSASDPGSGTDSGPALDWTWTVRLLGKAKPETVAEALNAVVTS